MYRQCQIGRHLNCISRKEARIVIKAVVWTACSCERIVQPRVKQLSRDDDQLHGPFWDMNLEIFEQILLL